MKFRCSVLHNLKNRAFKPLDYTNKKRGDIVVESRMRFTEEELLAIRDHYYLPLVDEPLAIKRFFEVDGDTRKRNEYQRDYTRVIYSSSFRRLQGKMQLLGVESDKFFRNRLTHSIEVAQIARSIAEDIGHDIELLDSSDPKNKNIYKTDTYVVEACALAHDIGNPPFGHKGEWILHNLCREGYGFEGNAQTLRVLMDLEKKYAGFGGINLTLRTLLGVTKYYRKYDDTEAKNPEMYEKFIYNDSYDQLSKMIKQSNLKVRTLDVQIVDLSDEIAYAAHDLEDTLSMSLFTVDDLLYEFKMLDKSEYSNAYEDLIDIVNHVRDYAKEAHRFKSSEEYSFLFRKELTATIVNKLIHDIHLIPVSSKHIKKTGTLYEKELGFRDHAGLAKALKEVVFNCVNRRDSVQLYEAQGEKIINGLFQVFIDNERYLPVEFRFNGCSDIEKNRKVIDYIAGMMDSYAISSFIKFYGPDSLDKIF